MITQVIHFENVTEGTGRIARNKCCFNVCACGRRNNDKCLSLALSTSFEYLCYGSTAIKCFNSFSAVTVFTRQNLMSTDDRF